MSTRRDFLGTALGLGALGLSSRPLAGGLVPSAKPGAALNILVLGGTGFIGPHFVSYALSRGHNLTLFNRGRSNTHLFPEAEKLVGDRNDDVRSLEGRRWDVVLDNSGYTPQQVSLSVNALVGSVGRYLFTSTRAVYTDYTQAVMNEDAPLGPKDLPEAEWGGYGPNKVLAERIVGDAFGSETLIVRPPIIVGPGDRTDRFTYWVDRIDDGGSVLVQGAPGDPVQFIDVRDLAEFYLHLLEEDTTGIYNCEGPEASLSSAELVHGIRAVTNTPVDFTWVDWEFLADREIHPPGDVTFWRAPHGHYVNYGRMDSRRAIAKGLTFRPLAVTAKETLDWHRTRSAEEQMKLRTGLSRDQETALLQQWKSR